MQTEGKEQAEQVADLLRALRDTDSQAFKDISVVADCYGKERFVSAWRC
jgi:hypothetical protein